MSLKQIKERYECNYSLLHTKQLLNKLDLCRYEIGIHLNHFVKFNYYENEENLNYLFKIERGLKNVLLTRENILNKRESKQLRIERIKKGR